MPTGPPEPGYLPPRRRRAGAAVAVAIAVGVLVLGAASFALHGWVGQAQQTVTRAGRGMLSAQLTAATAARSAAAAASLGQIASALDMYATGQGEARVDAVRRLLSTPGASPLEALGVALPDDVHVTADSAANPHFMAVTVGRDTELLDLDSGRRFSGSAALPVTVG